MNNLKPDIDDYFFNAKKQPDLLDDKEINSIINKANTRAANNPIKNYFNKKLGYNFMNIFSYATASIAIIAVISYGLFNDNIQNNNDLNISNINLSQNTQEINTSQTEMEKNNSNNMIADNNIIHHNNDSIKNNNSNHLKYNVNTYKSTVDIQGIKMIELTDEEFRKMGFMTINNNDYIGMQYWNNFPTLCTLLVKGGIIMQDFHGCIDSTFNPFIISPRIITDMAGNRRVVNLNDENVKILSSNYTQMVDSNNIFQETTISMKYNNDNKINSNSMNNKNFTVSLKKDTALTELNFNFSNQDNKNATNIKLNIDSLVKYSISNNDLNNANITTNIDFNDIQKYETELNENIGDYYKNNSKLYINDSLLSKFDFKLEKNDIENLNSNTNNFNLDLLLIDSVLFKRNISPDELKIRKQIEQLSNDKNNAIQQQLFILNTLGNDTNNSKNISYTFSNDINDIPNPNINNTTIAISLDESEGNTEDNINKDLNKLGSQLALVEKDLNNYIRINKLIPIKYIIKTKNTNSQTKEEGFILWFDANEELLKHLPLRISNSLKEEINAAKNTQDFCENNPKAGEDTYMDVWRQCSGSIKNLTIYPNPSKNNINIRYKLTENRNCTIALYDLNGQELQILSGFKNKTSGEWTDSFVLNDIAPGMYLIAITTDHGEQAVQRLIIEN